MISICDNIAESGVKDLCNKNVALIKNDSSICDKIQNEPTKNMCHEKIE